MAAIYKRINRQAAITTEFITGSYLPPLERRRRKKGELKENQRLTRFGGGEGWFVVGSVLIFWGVGCTVSVVRDL